MHGQLESHLVIVIGTRITAGDLPVKVLREVEKEYAEEADKWEIRQLYTEFKQQMKLWEYCLEHGHKIIDARAHITPDHGTEYLLCGRCGNEETIHWY